MGEKLLLKIEKDEKVKLLRIQRFPKETKRIEFLFELYDKYTAGIFAVGKKGRKK